MCLFVIRDVKNMFPENRQSTWVLSSPHSQNSCCGIHPYTSLCSDMRETVSLRLWLLNTTPLDRIWEFNRLVYAEASLYCFWSSTTWSMYFICLSICTYFVICPVGLSYFCLFSIYIYIYIILCFYCTFDGFHLYLCSKLTLCKHKAYILQQQTASAASVIY